VRQSTCVLIAGRLSERRACRCHSTVHGRGGPSDQAEIGEILTSRGLFRWALLYCGAQCLLAVRTAIGKMSDERLRVRLVQAGYQEEVVGQLDRQTMMLTLVKYMADEEERTLAAVEVQERTEGKNLDDSTDTQAEARAMSLEERRLFLEEKRFQMEEQRWRAE